MAVHGGDSPTRKANVRRNLAHAKVEGKQQKDKPINKFHMNLKNQFLIIILCIVYSNLLSQTECSINFGDYANSEFNQSDCTYELGVIPIQFFNIYAPPGQDMLCSAPNSDDPAFKAKIKKSDLPLVGKIVNLSVTQIGCPGVIDLFEYKLHYTNGQIITDNGESTTISNYNDLDYLTVTEIECGLIGSPGFVSPIVIKFESQEVPPNPDCSNNAINDIENLLTNPDVNRFDYHFYIVDDAESIVCNAENYNGSYDCTIDGVWEFLKSNNTYQAPIYQDFPTSITVSWSPTSANFTPYSIINKAFQLGSSGPYGNPVNNCDMVNIAPSPARQIAGLLTNNVIFQLTGPITNICLLDINVVSDPVILSVEEERKCITNYTLPGHILYPGKVERCVTSDDCGENIKIVTKGSGFHYCGNNWVGGFFGYMNEVIGEETFRNLSIRVNQAFNN